MKLHREEKQVLSYFQSSPVWARLFGGFRDKYQSYGYFTGTVKLHDLSGEEIEILEGFFGKNYHGQKRVSVSAKVFRAALAATRYGAIEPERLLALYFGEELQGKKEMRESYQNRQQEILEMVCKEFADTYAIALVQAILAAVKPEASGDIASQPREAQQERLREWEESLRLAMRICNAFPYREAQSRYLAVFAAQLTGNPHAFDAGTAGGSLLYRLVQADLAHRGLVMRDTTILRSYQRQRSYLAVGLLIDDVSNYVMLYGVQAVIREREPDGTDVHSEEMHPGMAGFCAEKDMVQVPLAVMLKWEKLRCPDQQILIVENPSIFAMLCAEDDGPHAYLCMNGQPRLAALIALDLLAAAGTGVCYAGDLDPEGLLIGQKLADYYPGAFCFVGMRAEDYRQSMSQESISNRRLKMLERITHPQLVEAAALMRQYRRAGYQELLIQKSNFGILKYRDVCVGETK